jgi:hypothetical protein
MVMEKGKQMSFKEEIDKALSNAASEGVRLGINTCISAIEELRSKHSKRSSGYNDLTLALLILEKLTVEQVEG